MKNTNKNVEFANTNGTNDKNKISMEVVLMNNNSNETDNKAVGEAEANDTATNYDNDFTSVYGAGVITINDYLDVKKGLSFVRRNLTEQHRLVAAKHMFHFFYNITDDLYVLAREPYSLGCDTVLGSMGRNYSGVNFYLDSEETQKDEHLQKGLFNACKQIYTTLLIEIDDYFQYFYYDDFDESDELMESRNAYRKKVAEAYNLIKNMEYDKPLN